MKKIILTLSFVVKIVSCLFAQSSNLTVAERTQSSEIIIEGKVIQKYGFWNENRTKIYTSNIIEVQKVFKGNSPQIIEIITLGGIIGDTFQIISHGKVFDIGEQGIFFCKNYPMTENKTENYLMLNSSLGFIKYQTSQNKIIASDVNSLYLNINKQIFEEITKVTQSPILVFSAPSNGNFDDDAAVTITTETNLEFTFDNISVNGNGEVEFDLMAKTNNTGIKFVSADVFVEYSEPAFGKNIVAENTVEVTKETIIQNSAYDLSILDEDSTTLKVIIGADCESSSSMYNLTTTFEKLLHIKIQVQDFSVVGQLTLDDFQMDGNAKYYDPLKGDCVSFDRIIIPNPIATNMLCNIVAFTGPDSENPHIVTAGTGDMLVITGENFGDDEGTVMFPNADDGGMTMMRALPEDVEWGMEEITVRVPSIQNSNMPAGSGIFLIETADGEMMCYSPDPLEIRYAVFNFRQNVNIGDAVRVYLSDINDMGQYVFHLNDDLAAMGDVTNEVKMITETALCDWNMATGINWILGDNTAINDALIDESNVIFMAPETYFVGENEDATAYTMITGARIGSCQTLPPDPEVYAFVIDVDIVIREDLNELSPPAVGGWFFDEMAAPATNQMDYYSVVLHELGHAHNLKHAIPATKVMYWQLIQGATRRAINADDKAGGEELLNASLILNNGINCRTPVGTNPGLCITDFNEIQLNPNGIDLIITPNPTPSHEIRVSYNLPQTDNIEIRFYNLFGQQIYQKKLGNQIKGQQHEIVNLPKSIPNGIYIMEMKIGSNIYVSNKFSKI